MAENDLLSEGPPKLSVSIDTAFDLLQNSRRRHIIRILADEGETTLMELTEQVAAIEYDKEIEELEEMDRKKMFVALYQAHLPKYDSNGVLDFDKQSGTVTPREDITLLNQFLSVLEAAFEEDTE